MKNKGFTLIELLAVIVILAIIALIAVPIIINIINDSRENANKRSIELYGKAVENAIAKAQLNRTEIAAGDLSSTFLSTVQYDGSRVTCTTNKLYSDGSIYLAGCTVNGKEVSNTYGTSKACEWTDSDSSGTINLSDEVTCGSESFYVMGAPTNNTITMLAAKNITTGENPRQSDDAGTIAFSTTNYWGEETGFVYDMQDTNGNYLNDVIHPIVNAYEIYLKNTLGVNSASATLMNKEQANSLGCIDGYDCLYTPSWYSQPHTPAPSWVYSTSYWLGSTNAQGIWSIKVMESSHQMYYGGQYNSLDYGVRPVITISTTDVG